MGAKSKQVPAFSDSEVESAFAKYIASQWNKLDRSHAYTNRKSGKSAIFTSLAQAYEDYHFDGRDKTDTARVLTDLSSRLQEELHHSKPGWHPHKLHHVCLDILLWGGVERAVPGWLAQQCDAGTLGAAIESAVTELCEGEAAPCEREDSVFQDGESGTPMDAGMTKICALAKPNHLVMYDGRVGAGLGYLTVQFVRTTGVKYLVDGASLPAVLAWAWGAGQTSKEDRKRRNPTRGLLKFACLRPGTPVERKRHATYMWRASRVLRKAVEDINVARAAPVRLSNLEMAIFMIGYDVTDLPEAKRSTSGSSR
jgi:hypothetical protein